MTNIHATAIVARNAELADGVEVGPYSVIHEDVSIASGCKIGAHSVIHSYVKLGAANTIADHVVLGGAPQDLSYQGEQTWLVIGNDNIFREYSSVHRSNTAEEVTRIGNGCYIMCNVHVGHNCIIGDDVILTAFAGLSGHVEVGDKAIIGGQAGIHQFCRIGTLAMVAGAAEVTKDVLPYCLLGRDPVAHYRLNTVGLRRAGITGARYKALEQRMRQIREGGKPTTCESTPEIIILDKWLAEPSRRGIYKFIR